MQAVVDALSLLANIVMAKHRPDATGARPLPQRPQRCPALIGRIAPTPTEGINLRGIFRFPVERYADNPTVWRRCENTDRGVANRLDAAIARKMRGRKI